MRAPRPVITYKLSTLIAFAAAQKKQRDISATTPDNASPTQAHMQEIARQTWQEEDEFIAATLEIFRREGVNIVVAANEIKPGTGHEDTLYAQLRREQIQPLTPRAYE